MSDTMGHGSSRRLGTPQRQSKKTTKEDRRSRDTALASGEWLGEQMLRAMFPHRGKTTIKAPSVAAQNALVSLEEEWERLAKNGPPPVPDFMAFMDRYITAYNAVWNRTKKGLCAKCGAFMTWTSTKAGAYCGKTCSNKSSGDDRTEREREARRKEPKTPEGFRTRWALHRQAGCDECTDDEPCMQFLMGVRRKRHYGTGGDAMDKVSRTKGRPRA